MKRSELMAELNRMAETVEEETGVELVRLLFIKDHGRRVLRITINKEGGVELKDCENFSRAFSKLLDEEDLIQERYFLEVESPGI
ncbi:MAG: ribosome maturation factor RimP [Vulcanimicrobiota bacterium]